MQSTNTTPEPEAPAPPSIRDLCHQWEIVAAKLTLEILERGHEQETCDHLCEPAEAQWREIERTILTTEPDDISDMDLARVLRLARKILDDDQYATSRDAAEAMLDLIDSTLCHRWAQERWRRVQNGQEAG